ncbi:MAG: sugar ABC transporter ATP-binding protein [Christensenellaceae bacterium]|jgi:ribose transport system ATP-binding protein
MEPIIRMNQISKIFPGVVALDKVDFDLYPGEVHVLLGANGAGKSTLMKILSGAYTQTSGTIEMNGKTVHIRRPEDSLRLGIRIIYQELMVNDLATVTENVFLGDEIRKGGFIDWKAMHQKTREKIQELNYDLDPTVMVGNLGIAKKQIVEIIKALHGESRVVVFDEPTAALSPNEIETLFGIIRGLKAKGIGIIYISHRLSEINEIGDRITTLRDGKKIYTGDVSSVTHEEIVRMISGKELVYEERVSHATDEIVLETNALRTSMNHNEGISMQLRRGEILGVTGLVGAGKTELARAICGIDNVHNGRIRVQGEEIRVSSPSHVIGNGVVYLSEDRRGEGLIVENSIAENISLPSMKKILKNNLISFKKENQAAKKYVDLINIKTASIKTPARDLSGGNQQKVVVAKWLFNDADIFVFDEPTRGIDVGAKEEIYRILFELVSQGKSIIVISSDTEEILRVSDRVIVMKDGKLVAELTEEEITKERILSCSLGVVI